MRQIPHPIQAKFKFSTPWAWTTVKDPWVTGGGGVLGTINFRIDQCISWFWPRTHWLSRDRNLKLIVWLFKSFYPRRMMSTKEMP